MRQFVVIGHEAPTTPEFPLDALPSEAGRLDVLCRCVTAALLLSHDSRSDVRVHVVLRDEFTVHFDGADLHRLNPDERSTAALIREALDHREAAVGHVAAESTPGVSISRRGVESVIDEVAADGTLVHLHADGTPVVEMDPPTDPVFVLSDHREFTERERDLLAERADRRVSLGPRALHADDAITVAHNYLDTDGFRTY